MNYAIIAAGEGSRLVKEGITFPKPLVELRGIPLIKRLIDIFSVNHAESIHIIVNAEMTEVHRFLKTMPAAIPLNPVIKSTASSMHSFFELSRFLQHGKFCLTTVDTVFREDEFSAFIRAFEADSTNDGLMAVTDYIDDEKPLYISVDEKTLRINHFSDLPTGEEKYISGGIYGLTPKAINPLRKCITGGMSKMRNYQRQLIADGLKLKAYPFSKILDVDRAGDIEKAELFLTNP
jgi:NDP-sugar pyrophosphorylase family protein